MKTDKKVIAAWGISNTASLNVYDVEYGINDRMLCGINDNTPRYYKVYYTAKGDAYIIYHRVRYHLNECMRYN